MKEASGKIQRTYEAWLLLWPESEKDTFVSFLIRIASILVTYVVIDRGSSYLTRLPAESYFEPFIFFEFVKRLLSGPFILVSIVTLAALIVFRKGLLIRWNTIEHFAPIRIFVVLCAGLLTWRFAAYDFNLYLNQAHYFDRFLLIAFAVLIYIRPVFAIPFLAVLLPVIWQFDTYVGFSWATVYLPIRVILLFSVFLIFKIVFKKFRASDYVFLTGCLIAAHYFAPGFGKLNLPWILKNRLSLFLPAAYTNGWFAYLETSTIESITEFLSYLDWPMKIFTLTAEVGALFFLLNRQLTRIFPILWTTLHIGIFLTSGIFFWMWILLDLAAFCLFMSKSGFGLLLPQTKAKAALSIFLIAGGVFWCRPVVLAWYEVPVSYGYRFEAETATGETFQLTPAFFTPYENHFTVGAGFGFLSKDPLLANAGGGTFDRTIFEKLDGIIDQTQLSSIKNEHGIDYYNPNGIKKLDDFLNRYLNNWNQRQSKNVFLNKLRPPLLIWTYPVRPIPDMPHRFVRITIIQTTAFFSNGEYNKISEKQLHQLEIAARPDP